MRSWLIVKAWLDIDNPPQVQYLLPLEQAFRRQGVATLVTARRYGITEELLHQRDVPADFIGGEFGARKLAKANGVLKRSARLAARVGHDGRPSVLVSSSRSSALTARLLGIPRFVVCDYEHAELESYRRLGSYILYPSVIPTSAFTSKGFRTRQLIPFVGLKEDLTFADINLESVPAHDFGRDLTGLHRVLFRPPAEQSHYFDPRSSDLSVAALRALACDPSIAVIFSPRQPEQIAQAMALDWVNPPVILKRSVPFVSLLKAVDGVVSSGGTMLREAAYLGIPAFSIFRSEMGAVDQHLIDEGLLHHVTSADALMQALSEARPLQPASRYPALPDELVTTVLERIAA